MIDTFFDPRGGRDPDLRLDRLPPVDLSGEAWRAGSTGRAAQDLENCCRTMVAQATEAVILVDADGTIRIWNHGAERLFGYAAVEALGSAFTLLVPSSLRATAWRRFRQTIDDGRNATRDDVFRVRTVGKGRATRYLDLSVGLVRDEGSAVIGAFAIGRDCTARHLAEKAMVLELQPETLS